jgi:TrpR-related protein YerC/YecD
MNQKITAEMIDLLYATLIKVKTKEDCELLLADLCTVNEVLQMAQRAKAAQLLLQGKTYTQVIAETDISSATLSRVSGCIRHGRGGYRKFIDFE